MWNICPGSDPDPTLFWRQFSWPNLFLDPQAKSSNIWTVLSTNVLSSPTSFNLLQPHVTKPEDLNIIEGKALWNITQPTGYLNLHQMKTLKVRIMQSKTVPSCFLLWVGYCLHLHPRCNFCRHKRYSQCLAEQLTCLVRWSNSLISYEIQLFVI